MPAITLKNIPEALYQRLKQSAELNHRSLNGELIACIEKTLMPQKYDLEYHMKQADTIRKSLAESFGSHKVTDEEINQAKNEGRP